MSQAVGEAKSDQGSARSMAEQAMATDISGNHASWWRSEILAGLFCSALSVLATALFLPRQSLWIDEIDQLGGLTLSPLEVVRWLAGWSNHDFMVPTDCMPPLSYWVGWLWSRVFGLGEIQLRWLGATCVALSTLIVFWTAREAWGLASGFAAGLLFALSPNVITMGVEIRAYPLYLLTSAATLWCFTRLLRDPRQFRTAWVIGLVACGIFDIYTHFFGLALIGSCLLVTLVVVASRGGKIGPILAAAGLIGIATLGVLPFAMASFRIYALEGNAVQTATAINAADLVKLIYRLFAGPPTSLSPWAVAASLMGAALGGVASLAPKHRGNTAGMGLISALTAGFVVVLGARFVLSALDTLAPRYNLWMVPAFILVLSSGLAAETRTFRSLALAGIVLLTASSGYSTMELAVRGDYFAHNPHRQIQATIRALGRDNVALIHDGPSWNYDLYLSLRYACGPDLRQYSYEDGDSQGIRVIDLPRKLRQADPMELDSEYLVVVSSRAVKSWEIVDHLRSGSSPVKEGFVARSLAASGNWIEVERKVMVAFVAARMNVFERVSRGPITRKSVKRSAQGERGLDFPHAHVVDRRSDQAGAPREESTTRHRSK